MTGRSVLNFLVDRLFDPDFCCSFEFRPDGSGCGFPESRRFQPHLSSLSYQSLSSSNEEVLRSMSYQQHLVALTKNYYQQNGLESLSSSSTSSPVQVPSAAAYYANRHAFLSPGTINRPCRSLPESRRTSFTSIQQQLGGSSTFIGIGRRQESYRNRSTSK